MSQVVRIQNSLDGDSVEVNLHGATVTSWKCKGQEMLFVSKNAVFDGKKAIRGGIPVIFPNFGPWDLGPQHGFARISLWKVAQEPKEENGETTAIFVLEDSEATRAVWDFRFKLSYKVTLGKCQLKIELSVENKDEKPFDFTTLLHTYFRVPDVTKTSVSGFSGLNYVDKVMDGKKFTEDRDCITVDRLTDRVYINSPSEHKLDNVAGGGVTLLKQNLPDTVVWNPWEEKAKAMSDFGDDEYPYMLCVEAGYVSKPFKLEAGKIFEAQQILSCQCGGCCQ